MARFSIILPKVGTDTSFEETLASILRYRPDHSQVIVLHGGHYADPYGLGKEVDFVAVATRSTAPNLAELINAGVAAARGTIVSLVRPGIQFTAAWDGLVESAFEDPAVAAVSPALVAEKNSDRLITAGVQVGAGFSRELVAVHERPSKAIRQSDDLLGPTSWAAFYRRSFLHALDRCDVELDDAYLDLDLALSFTSLQFKTIFLASVVLACEDSAAITEEVKLPHGCSAQRAANRFEHFISCPPAPSTWKAWLQDLCSWPWRWNQTTHARQRSEATKFESVDRDHHKLLEILQAQRSRLIAPGLHSRVVAQQRNNLGSFRRAA